MRRYEVILFDLDGTLTNPFIGISQSVQYALKKMGMDVPQTDELHSFVGPPIQESFVQKCHMTEPEVKMAISYYRERYTDKGIFENEIYPGIEQLLGLLKDQGYQLIIATSKPTVFAERIAAHFGLDQYFDHIIGSFLDGNRSNKEAIINHIIALYPENRPADFLMVGDRMHDIIGAHKAGIDSIGVLYGYGSEGELRQSKPLFLAESIGELVSIFEAFKRVNA